MSKKSNWDRIKHKTYNPDQEGYGDTFSWKNAFHERLKTKEKSIAPPCELEQCQTLVELTSTFKRLIKSYHPDVAGDTEENKKTTQKLIEEYQLLKSRY